jgi:hypothetical protein
MPACLALVFLLSAAPSAARAPCGDQTPPAFEARMELLRNGKEMGESVFTFATSDGRWRMESQIRGTRGLARFIGFRESSVSEGDYVDGAARPLHFERSVRAIKGFEWSADFDWQEGVVSTAYPDGESSLALQPGVVDETAIGLRIRAGLARGEDDWHLLVVDEDEVEQQHFALREVERIQTTLGCLEAYRVEKVRDPSSKRYTRTWYAAEHDFVPVRIEHGKQGDDHMESRITEITVDGRRVEAGPDC